MKQSLPSHSQLDKLTSQNNKNKISYPESTHSQLTVSLEVSQEIITIINLLQENNQNTEDLDILFLV